jgi:bifunctional non-homologous end joining protein LigD
LASAVSRSIVPGRPVLRAFPPAGDDWQHELKHDGWRIQIHAAGRDVALLSRNANELGHRFSGLVAALRKAKLPIVVIDGSSSAVMRMAGPTFIPFNGVPRTIA